MLPRTEFEMSENIRDFSVAYAGEKLLGCGALHFYSPGIGRGAVAGGRARTAATKASGCRWSKPGARSQGIRARRHLCLHLCAGFFAKMGFQEVERGELPLKAWKDCLRCPKFQSCDEIAVLRVSTPERWLRTRPAPEQASRETVC